LVLLQEFITMHGHLNVNLSRCTVSWTSNPIIICIKFRRCTCSGLTDNTPNSKQQCTAVTDRQSRTILTARHYYACWEMISTQLISSNFILFRLSTEHFLVPDIPFLDYTPLPSPWELSDTFTEPFSTGNALATHGQPAVPFPDRW